MAKAGVAKSKSKPKAALPKAGPNVPAGTGLWWGGLACGAAVVLSPASAILLAILTGPVLLVALIPEDGGGRRVALAALLFGLAGSIYPLHQLWNAGASVEAAIAIIHRPIVLLAAWTAILAGWFLGEVASVVLKLTADLNAASKRRTCMAALAALEEEWGPLPPVAVTAPK